MNVVRDFRNDLLKRKEVTIMLHGDSNPGYEHAKKEIAQHFKINDEVLVIKTLKGNFGSKSFLVDALIYDNIADKDKIEPKPKVKKAASAAGGAK